MSGWIRKNQHEKLNNNIIIRILAENELSQELFSQFNRRQSVTKCRRFINGEWCVVEHPFVEDWGEAEYAILVKCLKHTIQTGGVVYGAFLSGALKGFVSVEAEIFGSRGQYRDLSCIHISEELRGMGAGSRLFQLAAGWAKRQGAEKLYISAHSALETQAFYQAMGCVEASEYDPAHVEKEPCDCQLEYQL